MPPAEREDARWYEARFAFAVRDFEAAAKAASDGLASRKVRGSPDAKRIADATALPEASEDRASK